LSLVDEKGLLARVARLAEFEGIARLESRIRQVAHELTVALLDAWQQFREG